MAESRARLGQPVRSSRGVAAEELRRHNLSAVLEHLHVSGPVSRSQLTAMTGLNRSTVADLIGELSALGLVTEGPSTIATGPGRPSPVVDVRPYGAVVLAVEIAVDSLAVATVGIGGHIFNEIRVARPRGHFRPGQTVGDISQLTGPLLAALPSGHNLVGLGVAIVGITRRSDGFVHFAPNLGWRDVPLAEMLADELQVDVPIRVANDADLGALGEYRRGGLAGIDHLVFVSGEVGIGCGVIVDGSPLLGSAGYAGEAGHNLVNPDGRKCACGVIGCWETEAGEQALLRRVSGRVEGEGLDALDQVEELAEIGDEATLDALAETGRWLGIGIRSLINVFNPEMVVLGGLYHRFFSYLEAGLNETAGSAIDVARATTRIVRSSVGADAALVGAAELVFEEVIEDPAAVSPSR